MAGDIRATERAAVKTIHLDNLVVVMVLPSRGRASPGLLSGLREVCQKIVGTFQRMSGHARRRILRREGRRCGYLFRIRSWVAARARSALILPNALRREPLSLRDTSRRAYGSMETTVRSATTVVVA